MGVRYIRIPHFIFIGPLVQESRLIPQPVNAVRIPQGPYLLHPVVILRPGRGFMPLLGQQLQHLAADCPILCPSSPVGKA